MNNYQKAQRQYDNQVPDWEDERLAYDRDDNAYEVVIWPNDYEPVKLRDMNGREFTISDDDFKQHYYID